MPAWQNPDLTRQLRSACKVALRTVASTPLGRYQVKIDVIDHCDHRSGKHSPDRGWRNL